MSSIAIAEGAIEIERSANEGKVCEGVWKIAKRLALRADLFCEQPEVIGVSQPLEDQPGLIQLFGDCLTRPRQRFDEPERTHVKRAFFARLQVIPLCGNEGRMCFDKDREVKMILG